MKAKINAGYTSAAWWLASTPPETLQKFFGQQPEIATDGATITTDGGCEIQPVENKEEDQCPE